MVEFRRPRVMGIINCTPDSFFPGSRAEGTAAVVDAARTMIADGADILDLGGESTRPGSLPVDPEEQIRRVVPAIRAIRQESDIPVSIDTRVSAVAEAALDAGADIINDISSLSDDRMAPLASERGVPVILMHMKGTPTDMQDRPHYENAAAEIREALLRSAGKAIQAGIAEKNIILDPGIGFGKRHEDNLALLGRIDLWRPASHPLLIGLSRKSFLGRILEADERRRMNRHLEGPPPTHGTDIGTPADGPGDRLTATLAAHAWCLRGNVDILRVHDVRETCQLIAVWEALAWAS